MPKPKDESQLDEPTFIDDRQDFSRADDLVTPSTPNTREADESPATRPATISPPDPALNADPLPAPAEPRFVVDEAEHFADGHHQAAKGHWDFPEGTEPDFELNHPFHGWVPARSTPEIFPIAPVKDAEHLTAYLPNGRTHMEAHSRKGEARYDHRRKDGR